MSARARASYFEERKPRVEVIPMLRVMSFLPVFFAVISLALIPLTGVPPEICVVDDGEEIEKINYVDNCDSFNYQLSNSNFQTMNEFSNEVNKYNRNMEFV